MRLPVCGRHMGRKRVATVEPEANNVILGVAGKHSGRDRGDRFCHAAVVAAILLTMVWALISRLGHGCWGMAMRTHFDKQYLGSLVVASRSLPAATGSTDWPQGHMASAQALENITRCVGPMLYHTGQSAFHYKVINRSIYVEPHHFHDYPAAKYRRVFDEQLAVATWLYRDFPDVDLFVFFGDQSGGCDLDIPWLLYSATDTPGAPGAAARGAGPAAAAAGLQGFHFSMAEHILALDAIGYKEGGPRMRGFAIPMPDEWQHLSLSEQQLRAFTQCLNHRYPWRSKEVDVIWRGRDSGDLGRWSEPERAAFFGSKLSTDQLSAAGTTAAAAATSSSSLWNKRIALTAAAQQHKPELDIALFGERYLVDVDPPEGMVQQLLGKYVRFVPDWAGHMFSVSIDGFGPPFRLPEQLLLGGVVLKMASPMKEHFMAGLNTSEHYIEFNYNLSNWPDVAVDAVAAAKSSSADSARLQLIAAAAQEFGVRNFNLLAQLDALMGAIVGVKSHSPWNVTIPAYEVANWRPLASSRQRLQLKTPGLPKAVKRRVMAWHRLHSRKCASCH